MGCCNIVAGSVGTWLAEFGLFKTLPKWQPSDIDVFVMLQSQQDFESFLDYVVESFTPWFASHHRNTSVRIYVTRKYRHIVNIQWWITCDGTVFMCPEFSFIYCPVAKSEEELLNGFDLDVCKVSVKMNGPSLCVCMSSAVRNSIMDRVMNCVVRQNHHLLPFYFSMQKTVKRIAKYSARGFQFKTLTFKAALDRVLNIDDFVFVRNEVMEVIPAALSS